MARTIPPGQTSPCLLVGRTITSRQQTKRREAERPGASTISRGGMGFDTMEWRRHPPRKIIAYIDTPICDETVPGDYPELIFLPMASPAMPRTCPVVFVPVIVADDHVLAISQECSPGTQENESMLHQPRPEARPRIDSCRHMPTQDELGCERQQGKNGEVPCPRSEQYQYPIAQHPGLGRWVTAGDCPSSVRREMAPSDAREAKHQDVERFAFRDKPGQDTGTSPFWAGTSWDSRRAWPTTVSQRPPKPLRIGLMSVSIAGAVLMTQWRLEYTSKWPDNLQSHFTQPELLSHPGVLVLGISLHSTALTLFYHLNGGNKRQDAFLIPLTCAAAILGSLLGLELSTILLRVTPWANIIALYASTYRKQASVGPIDRMD
ncbi:hypothetical protein GGTG_02196 [Gaeumannomyces tritici R3-111a-1]|uniref:Uncharacterized protein n=1 Tax=Gaeumannomyces tritici (strain R3-111a-1) TaxID=644352 RepID=J3NLP6_GAET3|nr:hypothetical protein GGTG_02196 [Gaeumannomyces tritici R3-111a-1]EJT82222.1 hypothetical protein GGTG_02196 [Gaeumannomyces tritici R3-111a-1]